MSLTAFAETADYYRIDASQKLDAKRRSTLGQYMTPVPTGRFMVSLFDHLTGHLRVLDPGAGVGSLTAVLVERLCTAATRPCSVEMVAYEIEPLLIEYLRNTLAESLAQCRSAHIKAESVIHEDDFILHYPANQVDLFGASTYPAGDGFTHIIMNPPYKKINSGSDHRLALSKAGIETSNLYTAFMYLAAKSLEDGGEMVAIVPRSFCNGPYFKPFRKQFFSMMALRHIHVFESRSCAFKDDEVLQENIIIHAVKGAKPSRIVITASHGSLFEYDRATQSCVGKDMTQRLVDYGSVIKKNDPDQFVHIATNDLEQGIMDRMAHFTASLYDLGVEVSTGPVVDFRLKVDLRSKPEEGSVPLLYAAHFQQGKLEWPKIMRKPNAIHVSGESRKWLWRNEGYYVVTRRFTSKEERRRIVASVYASDLPGDLIGFENHLNVFHVQRKGMSVFLAKGLSIYLNSSLVDRFFRQFNGHTQVNATDLRSMKYPAREILERMGKQTDGLMLTQEAIDHIIEEEIAPMTDDVNPLLAQQKIDEALKILKALGMPRGQQNDRSALTLLALANLKPEQQWSDLQQNLMGITPIMDYVRKNYGREYAPNTRETFRRQTMHQFVEAGIALYNPDEPERPVNSPNACYQISEEAGQVMLTFGTDDWETAVETYLNSRQTLAAKWAKHRQMRMIPVTVAPDKELNLTPGVHSELIKEIITEFAPRFAPGAEVIYVGDTGDKIGYFQEARLADFGVLIDRHGKMPDVVLYFADKGWLLLIESVTSHGPVNAKRHNELASLFKNADLGLVYVTAFPTRSVMSRYLVDISWETEVWCADTPAHLIHFNGERFLGPYEVGSEK